MDDHRTQAEGERVLRKLKAQDELDQQLGAALRASGITADDTLIVEMQHAIYASHDRASHRVTSAMRAIRAWLNLQDDASER